MDLPQNYRDWAILIAMVLVIVAAGYFALNGFLEFKYKSYWLSNPCDLCMELNPNLEFRQAPYTIDVNLSDLTFPKAYG